MSSWGLPLGPSVAAYSTSPQSKLVGASCLLLGVCGLHSAYHGDWVSSVLAFLTTLLSFCADYVNNIPDLWSSRSKLRVCALDRSFATIYSLWLVRIAVFQLGAIMLLSLLPLALVLSFSRASTTRSSWVTRHSLWHVFCVFECLCIMQVIPSLAVCVMCMSCRASETPRSPLASKSRQAVYLSDEEGELHGELKSFTGAMRLAKGPIVVGLALAIHGIWDAERRFRKQKA